MKILRHLCRRFYTGLLLGATLPYKIKAAFGLVFISRLPHLQFLMKAFNKTHAVTLRNGSDAAMFVEMFGDQEYALPNEVQPKTIVDLGSNVGFSVLYFALRNPNATIVAVEPDPYNQTLLQKNIGSLSNIKILKAAIADTPGTRTFYSVPNQGMSSSLTPRKNGQEILVTTHSIQSLLDSLALPHIDLMKFDIEGAEWDAFKAAPVQKITTLIGEYHADLTGKNVEDFVALFPDHGAKIKRLSNKRFIVLLTKN